ncbi:hypothetical protein COCOBI_12-4910 [Coccomyxa sp. Obi]|nr:hypothetical protein COCOBI_12-4910 [Coccomyxa sp. Obi]
MFAPMGCGDLDSSDDDCSEDDDSPASRSPFHPGTPKGEQKLLQFTGDENKERLCVMCCLIFTPEDTALSQWKLELELWASVCIPCMSSVLCRALRETVDERLCPNQTARPASSAGFLTPLTASDGHNKHLPKEWKKDLTRKRDEPDCNSKCARCHTYGRGGYDGHVHSSRIRSD